MGNIPTTNDEENPTFGDIPQRDRPRKPDDPRGRMGVYKSIDDVPDRYRLRNHSAAYKGRDVWATWQAKRTAENTSDRFRQNIDRAGRRWANHMEDRGRHHALARSEDVDAFFRWIIEDKGWKVDTAYQPYFVQVSTFYEWLQWHTGHPHHYNPVLMAAVNGDVTPDVWQVKIDKNDKR